MKWIRFLLPLLLVTAGRASAQEQLNARFHPPASLAADTTQRDGGFIGLLPVSILASGGGYVLGTRAGGSYARNEAGYVALGMLGGTVVNAFVVSGWGGGSPTLPEAVGAALVGSLAGIAAAWQGAGIADRHNGNPEPGIAIGFALGQGTVAALIGAWNRRTRAAR